MPEAWARQLKRFYLAAVTHTDELFGRVLNAVAARGEEGNTVVAVVGDHGWHLGEQGMWAKCTEFNAATRAPFIIKVPGVTTFAAAAGGVRSNAITEHVDLLPTLAAAVGLPPVPTCPMNSRNITLCTEGLNILPLAADATLSVKKAAFTQWPHPFGQQPVRQLCRHLPAEILLEDTGGLLRPPPPDVASSCPLPLLTCTLLVMPTQSKAFSNGVQHPNP